MCGSKPRARRADGCGREKPRASQKATGRIAAPSLEDQTRCWKGRADEASAQEPAAGERRGRGPPLCRTRCLRPGVGPVVTVPTNAEVKESGREACAASA